MNWESCWVYDIVSIHKKYMYIIIYGTFNTFLGYRKINSNVLWNAIVIFLSKKKS